MSKVIGNGLIGTEIKKNIQKDNLIFFTSGVSNSNEERDNEFLRERNLFYENTKNLKSTSKVIYFSTYSIFDNSLTNSSYRKHKLEMEKIVQKLDNHLIIRLPNVIGNGGNPNTMINFFKNSIINNQQITILKNAYRNVLDIDDIMCFIKHIDFDFPKVINLLHPVSYKVIDILECIETKMKKKVTIKKIEGGENYFPQPDDFVLDILKKCDLDLTKNYLDKLLNKYI